jgi:small subunit ribosomal protein S4
VSKRLASKYKISRRLGVSLWGRAKDPYGKRNYAPGQHGATRRRKLSGFGIQLNEKQKLKGYYGNISEKQFRRTYEEAFRRRGDTGEILIGLLESRLDAFVYRMGVVPTVFSARQFVNHGHVLVNGKRVNIPSYTLKEGDVVTVKEKSRQITLVMSAMQSPERNVPDYVQMDDSKLEAKFLRMPKLAEVPYAAVMEPNLVIEYYSR